MAKNNLVSVIINCFNGEKYVHESINSLLNQTYTHWELIFWDNCSTDKTKIEFDKLSDPRLNYFLANKHTSQYEARNQALKNCNGEFIAFLDVDDWWNKSKLEKQLKLFEDKQVGFSCTNAWIINERKNKKRIAFKDIPNGKVLENLLQKNFVTMSTLMIRKNILELLDYNFNPRYEIIGDFDLVLRLAQITICKSLQEPLAYYRQHEQNLTHLKIETNIKELVDLHIYLKKNDNITKTNNYLLFKNNIIFSHSLILILEGKRVQAFIKIIESRSFIHFIKFLLILILPKNFIRKLRSR